MFKKIKIVLILALSLTALQANADDTTSVYYSSMDIDVSAGLSTVKAADLDGFGITSSFSLSDRVSIIGDYTRLTGTVLSFPSTMTGIQAIVAYDLFNDLSLIEGTGSRLRAGIGYISQKVTIKVSSTEYRESSKGATLGANFEAALSEDISIDASVSGLLKDFDPTIGIGASYRVGSGKIRASYSAKEETIGLVKIKVSGFNIGYTFEY